MTITRLFAALFAVWMMCVPAAAQNTDTYFYTPGGGGVNGAIGMCLNAASKAVVCSDPSALPSPVSGTFSATLAGFTPNGAFGTLTATAATSASTAMPAGAVVAFQNKSSVDLSCVLSAGAATATTDKLIVRAGATVFFTVGSNVNAACINQTGSASNVVVMAGGAGLGTNFGGASAGGGGGGAVFGPTANGTAAANPPVLMGGTIDGSATGAIGNWKVIANGTGFIDAVAGGNMMTGINGPTPACAAAPCITTIGNTGIDLSSGKGTPLSNPIALSPLATPVNAAFSTSTSGGTLAATTAFFYRVSATNASGETLASTETSITTGAGATNSNTVNWGAVTGATGYNVYGRTTGAELKIATLGNVLTFVDTGSVTPSGALPAANTTAGTTQIVALSGVTLIYVTSYDVMASGTTNVSFVYGTGTNCATGQTALTGPYPLTAQAGIAKGAGIGTVLKVPSGNALCVTNSGNLQIGGSVSFQQF